MSDKMTGRERMLRTFAGKPCDGIPVTPHWWGLYKFAHAGLIAGYEDEGLAWSLPAQALADVDTHFYQDFRPDMLHLTTGPARIFPTAHEEAEFHRLFQAVAGLESYAVIDEYVKAAYPDQETVIRSGVFDHIPILATRHGGEALLMLNEGNPVSWILDPHGCVGFENGMIALIEKPDKMEYLLHRCYEALLPRMAALKHMDGDGYIGSETYCSADLISPDLYRQIIFEPQRRFYTALHGMGLAAVSYFLGDVNPLLPDLARLGLDGLMIEESKKSFDLDIARIYQRLEGAVTLFGNLDSVYVLQTGTRDEVIAETGRQLNACSKGRFIMANGCPVSFSTLPGNIRAMIGTTRAWAV
ncbi:MAG: uroporphyrinogen decarboxylase family protein [Saccharofermentanales bacterium]